MPVVSRGRLRSLVAWTWFPHAALFTLALALRVTWVLAIDRKGFAFNDALMYHSTAENLSEGHGYVPFTGGPTARWPPGFSTVLGGLYWLFGVHPIVGELFNAIVGAATVVLLMLIAERTLDRRTAIVAGAMLALLPGPIMWTDVLVSETLYTALFVAALLILVRARPTWSWLLAFGVAVGIGALVRGEALTWLVLPVVVWWRLVPWRELARVVLVAVAVAAVVMLPWTVRNAVVMDAFVPVATNASQTLWSGHNDHATGAQVYPPADYDDRFDQTLPAIELETSKALRNDAIEYMVTHPFREVELMPLKLLYLNRGDSYVLDWVNAPGDQEAPPISTNQAERIGVVADLGYYGLLTLTVLGAVVLGRRFWASRIGRIAATSFATALFLYGFLYYGNYRYRLPYEPLMVLVAATLVTRVFRSRELLADGVQNRGESADNDA
jgi:4-amino-4-deoxy-L-arabinose transferase-like glycosyltransferase